MRHLTLALSLALLAAAPFALSSGAALAAADAPAAAQHAYPDISKADLDAAIAAKTVVLLDCNGSDSFAAGHIPGAVDYSARKADLAALLPKDKGALVVAYCGGPQCGAYKSGATAAEALGYTNVKHFSAGISGWKDAKGTLEK